MVIYGFFCVKNMVLNHWFYNKSTIIKFGRNIYFYKKEIITVNAIEVCELHKEFEYYHKEQGLQGSLRNLFHREKLVKEAVKSLSFGIGQGEIVGFLGPNGAGKTTSLKMLSGILYPTHGSADVLGFTPWERRNEFKRQISIIMGQKNQLWWDLPACESMFLNKQIYGIKDSDYKKRLNDMCELLEVQELLNIQVRRLSLGERMKMELIAALLHHPKVLFLDEPTIGLDVISQKNIRKFLKQYNRDEGVTILLTSHYMEDISELCRRSIVINHGEVIYDDDTENISSLIGGGRLIKFKLYGREHGDFSAYGALKEQKDNAYVLEAPRERVNYILKELTEKYEVQDFTVENLPIEEGIALLYQSV